MIKTLKYFIAQAIVMALFSYIYYSMRINRGIHNPYLFGAYLSTMCLLGASSRWLFPLIFDTSHLPVKRRFNDEQIADLKKKGVEVILDKPLLTLKFLIELASKNGFVITEAGIRDTIDSKTYPLLREVAEKQLESNPHHGNLYTTHKEAIILNRAVRYTLMSIPRFVSIMNESKYGLVRYYIKNQIT